MPRNLYKVILALMLLLNHSLLFGVTEAAHIPDEEHPFGHTVVYDHSGDQLPHADHDEADHEQHHKHGLHIHLGAYISSSVSIVLQTAPQGIHQYYSFLHLSPAYSPPVPPPNH